VVSGPFRFTRNPMYLGLTSLLFAWATYLGSPLAVLGPVAFVLYITRFQIMPEEQAMAAKFGADYEAYRKTVRRWI
jgi:protein-S-isoprenylcysteine O-methyltransferase Ste14